MRKEILFAFIVGLIFGLVIAFGVWRINSSLNPRKQEATSTENTEKQHQAPITLAQPTENDVVSQSPMAISAITVPNALVAVAAEEEDYLTGADTKGAFGLEVDAVGGVNQIVFTSFEGGKPNSYTLTVVYSTEVSKLVRETPTETPVSTDSVRQKVQEKVDEALNSPTSYLGTVTDISASTIQLKTGSGEIQQVSKAENPA